MTTATATATATETETQVNVVDAFFAFLKDCATAVMETAKGLWKILTNDGEFTPTVNVKTGRRKKVKVRPVTQGQPVINFPSAQGFKPHTPKYSMDWTLSQLRQECRIKMVNYSGSHSKKQLIRKLNNQASLTA